MSRPIRLNADLLQLAEMEAQLSKRSAPKQIEFWADIGRRIEQLVAPNELVALTQGFAKLRLELTPSEPVDPDAVFRAVDEDRDSGRLAAAVSRAAVRYEASRSHPGLLDRIHADGSRESGRFHEGTFIPVSAR